MNRKNAADGIPEVNTTQNVLKYTGLLAGAMLGWTVFITPLQAQVHRDDWHPDYTAEVFQAQAPDNLAARQAAFANRNSPKEVEKMARLFFNLVNGSSIPEGPLKTAWGKANSIGEGADWQAALDAYRDFFVERLRYPPPEWMIGSIYAGTRFPLAPHQPEARIYYQYLHTADDLMNNRIMMAMEDKNKKRVTVPINIGAPGSINWGWYPKEFDWPYFYLPTGAPFLPAAMGQPNFFHTLLQAYLETRDPKYLHKWAEFIDDRYLNWRADSAKAGFVMISGGDTECYTRSILPSLMYLARQVPNFEKDFPANTLVREILRIWVDYVPKNIRLARSYVSNRRLGICGNQIFFLSILFPELNPAQYLMTEKRRLIEAKPVLEMMPDGGDIEHFINYNLSYALAASEDIYALRTLRDRYSWCTAAWTREVWENVNVRCTYLIHRVMNSGCYPQPWPGWRVDFFFTPLADWSPATLADPNNARILHTLFGGELQPDDSVSVLTFLAEYGRGKADSPDFDSEAFPYSGYYYLRSGWGQQDHCGFMPSQRPYQNEISFDNSLTLYAYGQDLLWPQWDTPVVVDGCAQINVCTAKSYPESYLNDRKTVKYAVTAPTPLAWQTVLPNRWHDSADFALCEGTYKGPFADTKPDTKNPANWEGIPGKFIDNVAHHRQVFLAKKLGLWIVADRLRSKQPHDYALQWSLAAPREWTDARGHKKAPGFTKEQVSVDDSAKTIKTRNPDSANLSIYHFSPIPLKMTTNSFLFVSNTPMTWGGNLHADGDQMIISALYPRRTIKDELTECKRFSAAGVEGFDAVLPDGRQILYRAALEHGQLQDGNVQADAEALILAPAPDGSSKGIVLGCREFSVGGRKTACPSADFEFETKRSKQTAIIPIYRPMDRVEIHPKADRFAAPIKISMSSPETNVDIRYTMDGTDPTVSSLVYTGPFLLERTATIKARAFRKGLTRTPSTVSGTHMSMLARAVYTKEDFREPVGKPSAQVPGLSCHYFEEGDCTLSPYVLDALWPTNQIIVKELFDISAKKTTNTVYAFRYMGFLDIPADGVYSFHAPEEFVFPYYDCGYDLRVFLDNEEWYPAMRWHNYGVWSIPLKKGKHALKVDWVDQRTQDWYLGGDWRADWRKHIWDGEKPTLQISGPGLTKQPIPANMLFQP